MTSCASSTCVGVPTGLSEPWLKFLVKKDSAWDYTKNTSVEEYASLFHSSVQEFDSFIGTSDPDLSSFQAAGGKLITYHRLADGLIPARGTTNYYDRVLGVTPNAHDFFRYFQVPGPVHCSGGNGGQPTATFQALVYWVERGIAPKSLPIQFYGTDGRPQSSILCPYPEKARLKPRHGHATTVDSFECSL